MPQRPLVTSEAVASSQQVVVGSVAGRRWG